MTEGFCESMAKGSLLLRRRRREYQYPVMSEVTQSHTCQIIRAIPSPLCLPSRLRRGHPADSHCQSARTTNPIPPPDRRLRHDQDAVAASHSHLGDRPPGRPGGSSLCLPVPRPGRARRAGLRHRRRHIREPLRPGVRRGRRGEDRWGDAAALAGLRGPLPVQPDPRGARGRELGRRLADLPRGHLHDPVRRLLQKVRRGRRHLLVGLRPELAGLHLRMQEVAPAERGLGLGLILVVGVVRAGPASYDADREQHAGGLGDAAVAQGPGGDIAVPVSGEHQHHGLQQEVRGRRYHLPVRLRQGWAGLHVPMRRRDGAPGSARVAAGGGGALAASSALSLHEPILIQPDSIR